MTQILAHRGASRAERENTIAAFVRAGVMGAHGVELDVRRTADDQLVVHHDAHLDDGRVIRATSSSDLPAHVPNLEQALDACEGMWVNIEIKNDATEPDFDSLEWVADQTMQLLARRGDPERWLISSFRIETIDRCRAIAPHIRTAWLTVNGPPDVIELVRQRGHAALHPNVRYVTRDLVEQCHRVGLAVNTWTCDDPARMRDLILWGVDGICTNVPDIALAVLAESS